MRADGLSGRRLRVLSLAIPPPLGCSSQQHTTRSPRSGLNAMVRFTKGVPAAPLRSLRGRKNNDAHARIIGPGGNLLPSRPAHLEEGRVP